MIFSGVTAFVVMVVALWQVRRARKTGREEERKA
jgi:hypothetical protein